jgi:hypothetical protein
MKGDEKRQSSMFSALLIQRQFIFLSEPATGTGCKIEARLRGGCSWHGGVEVHDGKCDTEISNFACLLVQNEQYDMGAPPLNRVCRNVNVGNFSTAPN